MNTAGGNVKITKDDIVYPERLAAKIAAGADVNASISELYTPLGYAAGLTNAVSCRLLLEAGANPDVGNAEGASPLSDLLDGVCDSDAGRQAIRDVMAMLFAHGANPDGNPAAGETPRGCHSPVFQASIYRHYEALETLAAHGANLDRLHRQLGGDKDASLRTVLTAALQKNDEDAAIALLRCGAKNLYAKETGMRIPFHYAVEQGLKVVMEYFVRERGERVEKLFDGSLLPVKVKVRPDVKEFLYDLQAYVFARETEAAIQDSLPAADVNEESVQRPRQSKGVSPL